VFWGTFFPGMEGFSEIKNPDIDIFRQYMPDIAASTESGHKPGESVICTGKIKHVASTYVDQWNYLKSIVPKERVHECKMTLPAPEWYHMRYRGSRVPERRLRQRRGIFCRYRQSIPNGAADPLR